MSRESSRRASGDAANSQTRQSLTSFERLMARLPVFPPWPQSRLRFNAKGGGCSCSQKFLLRTANVPLHRHSRRAPEQSQESRPRAADERADRRHRRVRLGQVVAGVRHALRGRSAPLRRNVLAVRAAVSRSHGSSAGRSHRRHSAGDRHRPDQSGAHLALHRRHDDGAQRSPEAAVLARRAAVLPRVRALRCKRDSAQSIWPTSVERLAAERSARRESRRSPSRSPVPHNFTEEEVLALLEKQGYTRVFAPQRRRTASSCDRRTRRKEAGSKRAASGTASVVLEMIQDRVRLRATSRERMIEALESALRVGGSCVLHASEADSHATASTPAA